MCSRVCLTRRFPIATKKPRVVVSHGISLFTYISNIDSAPALYRISKLLVLSLGGSCCSEKQTVIGIPLWKIQNKIL